VKALKIGLGVFVVALVVLVFSLPITTTPGFFIFGNASAAPANWPDTSSILETKIRVPGVIPRVVITWFVEIDNDMYIVGATANGWTAMLGDGGPVHMRIEDSTYPLQAERVGSGTDQVLQAWEAKYVSGYPDFFGSSAADEYLVASAIYRLRRM